MLTFPNCTNLPRAIIISTPYFLFSNSNDINAIYSLLDFKDFTKYYFTTLFSEYSNLYHYREIFQNIPSFLFRAMTKDERRSINYGYAININPTYRYKTISSSSNPLNSNQVHYSNDGYSLTNNKNKRNAEYFYKLLQAISDDGVKIFLLETPEYYEIDKELTGRDIFYSEIEKEISNFSNIHFIKQLDIKSINRKNKEMFFNGGLNSHLSFKASKIFSKEILNILISDNEF